MSVSSSGVVQSSPPFEPAGKQLVKVSVLRVISQTDRAPVRNRRSRRWNSSECGRIGNNAPDDAPGYPVANRIGHGGEFQYGERSNVCHLKKESERRINWIWCSTVSEMLCWRICRDPSENTVLAEVPPHRDFSFAQGGGEIVNSGRTLTSKTNQRKLPKRAYLSQCIRVWKEVLNLTTAKSGAV